MTNLARVKVVYSGWDGAPGVNILHFSGGTTGESWDSAYVGGMLDDLNDVYDALAAALPFPIVTTVPTEAEIIDSDSGQLVNVVSSNIGSRSRNGTVAGGIRGTADMALARFITGEFHNGRHVLGRAFIGPIAAQGVDEGGNINAAVQGFVSNAWDAVISNVGVRLCVYSMPRNGSHSGGHYADVQSVTCPPKMAILKSRRD